MESPSPAGTSRLPLTLTSQRHGYDFLRSHLVAAQNPTPSHGGSRWAILGQPLPDPRMAASGAMGLMGAMNVIGTAAPGCSGPGEECCVRQAGRTSTTIRPASRHTAITPTITAPATHTRITISHRERSRLSYATVDQIATLASQLM